MCICVCMICICACLCLRLRLNFQMSNNTTTTTKPTANNNPKDRIIKTKTTYHTVQYTYISHILPERDESVQSTPVRVSTNTTTTTKTPTAINIPRRDHKRNKNHLPHSTVYVGYIFRILPERDETVPSTPVRVSTSSHHTVPRRSPEPITVCRELLQSNSPPANPGRAGQKYCLCYVS